MVSGDRLAPSPQVILEFPPPLYKTKSAAVVIQTCTAVVFVGSTLLGFHGPANKLKVYYIADKDLLCLV